MTEDCAALYAEFMKECTYYPYGDIDDTTNDFREWLKKKRTKNDIS